MSALLLAAVLSVAIADTTDRRIVVTVDDLPVISTRHAIGHWREVTRKLLDTFARHRVPAIGFVNEDKLVVDGALDTARVALLRQWADAGLELGNHTWSHPSLHATGFEAYRADIVRGEPVTRRLMEERGRRLRYFRHPFLHTGRRVGLRDSVVAFLAERGCAVAPVTMDNSDWVYARAYDRARDRGDRAAMRRVAAEYVDYMGRVVEFWERQSVAIVGREMPQVLLIHANAINADYGGAVLEMLRGRGYRFIALEEALRDPAFGSEDRWTGAGGISWIHRWGLTRGVAKEVYRGEPEPGEWVVKLSEVE